MTLRTIFLKPHTKIKNARPATFTPEVVVFAFPWTERETDAGRRLPGTCIPTNRPENPMNILNFTGTARNSERVINPHHPERFRNQPAACLAARARQDRATLDANLGDDAHLGILVPPQLAAALRAELQGERIDVFHQEPSRQEIEAFDRARRQRLIHAADPTGAPIARQGLARARRRRHPARGKPHRPRHKDTP